MKKENVELSEEAKLFIEIVNKSDIKTYEIRRLIQNSDFRELAASLNGLKVFSTRTKRMISNILKEDINKDDIFMPFRKNRSLKKTQNEIINKITKKPSLILDSNKFQYYKGQLGATVFLDLLKSLIDKKAFNLTELFRIIKNDYSLINIIDFNKISVGEIMSYFAVKIDDMSTYYFSSNNIQLLIDEIPEKFYEAFNKLSNNPDPLFKSNSIHKNLYNVKKTNLNTLLDFLILDFDKIENKVYKLSETLLNKENVFYVDHEWSIKVLNQIYNDNIKLKNNIILINNNSNKYDLEKINKCKNKKLIPFPLNEEEQGIYGLNNYFFDLLKGLNSLCKSSYNSDYHDLMTRVFNEIWSMLSIKSKLLILTENQNPYYYFIENIEYIENIVDDDLELNDNFHYLEDLKEMRTAI